MSSSYYPLLSRPDKLGILHSYLVPHPAFSAPPPWIFWYRLRFRRRFLALLRVSAPLGYFMVRHLNILCCRECCLQLHF